VYQAVRQRAAALLYARNRLDAEAARLRREMTPLTAADARRERLRSELATVEAHAGRIRARAEQAKARLLEIRDALQSLQRHRLYARAAEAGEQLAGDTSSDLECLTAELQLDHELSRVRER
jgi:hypothetical protein